jgi:hypothetical protein
MAGSFYVLVATGPRLRVVPNPNPNNETSLNAIRSRSLRKTTMKRFFVAILLSALALFSISSAVHARVSLRVISVSGATSAQDLLEKMTSEPLSIALLGAGLLVVGGFIRRQRSRNNAGSGKRSLDGMLETGD